MPSRCPLCSWRQGSRPEPCRAAAVQRRIRVHTLRFETPAALLTAEAGGADSEPPAPFPGGFLYRWRLPAVSALARRQCPLPLARRGGVRGPCIRGCLLKLLESCLQGRVKLRKGLCNGAKRLHCWKMMVCGVLVRRVIAGLPIRVFRTWQETGCAEQQRCILRIARCIALPGRLRVVKQLHLFIQNHRQLLQ